MTQHPHAGPGSTLPPSEMTNPTMPTYQQREMVATPDGLHGSQDTPYAMPDNQEIYCKLVLSNILAGSLIGKNGSTISAIRQKSGANIRISNVANAYSPERLALICGVKDAIANALDQVVELGAQPFGGDGTAQTAGSLENGIMMKVIIPKSSVSVLIGKGGQRINEMRQMTGAKIHVSTKEESPIPTAERIVKIIGSDACAVSSALLMVIIAIQSDPQVKDQHNFGPDPSSNHMMPAHSSPLGHHYPGTGSHNIMNGFSMNSMHMDYVRSYGMEPWMTERNCELFMQVPDAYVGMLVGRSGQHITDIKLASHAKIEISKKGDFVEGTTDRLVTISGSIMSVHAAHARLMKRILELQNQDTTSRQFHKHTDEPHLTETYYNYN